MRTTAMLLSLVVILLLPVSAAAQEVVVEPWPDPGFGLQPAQLDRVDADLRVRDGSVSARMSFLLSAPPVSDGRPAEGRIVFPVPAGSSVSDLVLAGGPETLEGKLLDAAEAAALYDEIVSQMIDPALLRSLGGDLYEVRAFPVPPGEARTVRFTVTSPLPTSSVEALVEVPWSGMSPTPASATVALDVDLPFEVRTIIAPGYTLDVERRSPGEFEAAWEAPASWLPETDFRLHLGGGEGILDTRLLAYREAGENGTFALLFAPGLEAPASVARDIVLVLDTSGSMEGDKMTQAIEAAVDILEHIGPDDRFEIIDFSRDVHSFRGELADASDAEEGITYLRDLVAGGDTNISGALDRGLSTLDGSRPGTVIFLTDGLPTAGIESTDGILDLARQVADERMQLFAFGVGYDVDTVLLDALAREFAGSSHYVVPGADIETEVSRLYERISTPVLTDVTVSVEGVETSELAPAGLPAIFAGDQAVLTGRYEGSGDARIVVEGRSADGPVELVYEVSFPERASDDPAIANLWAQRRVADLLTELRTEGQRDSLVEEIVELATRYGIITPYTSALAQEPEMAFAAPGDFERALDDAVLAAPSTGQAAVEASVTVNAMKDNDGSNLGGFEGEDGQQRMQQQRGHAFYLVEGTWTRDDYEPDTAAPEVIVGSPAFAALLAADPSVADAIALGERVVTMADGAWVTLVWDEAV